MSNIRFKFSFTTICQDKSWLKKILIGGLLQLLLMISAIIPILGWVLFICLCCYFCGYYLSTIKSNINNDNFVWVDFNEKNLMLNGAKFIGAMLLFFVAFYFLIMLLGTIVLIPVFAISSLIGLDGGGQGVGWLGIAIVMFLVFYGVYPYLFITIPASIANYINEDRVTSLWAFKKIFKIFKNNWKITLKTALTLLLAPLMLVPFWGFYVALVLAKILSNYIEIVNKNDCEVDNA